MDEEKVLTFYLAPWQKRMIMDFLPRTFRKARFNKLTISKIPKIDWVTYRVPVFEGERALEWNLYLTDEQIDQVVEVTGIKTKISALLITPAMLKEKTVVIS